MKRTAKTQIGSRGRAGRGFGGGGRPPLAVFTLLFPAAALPARPSALPADAQAVLDVLDRRIAAAEASQASRDRFLEAIHPDAACRDWLRDARLRRDPDLRSALEEACPDLPGAARRRRRRAATPEDTAPPAGRGEAPSGKVTSRIRVTQEVRPRGEGLEGPDLAGAAEGYGLEAEASAAGGTLRTRHAAFRGGGDAWGARAGRLDFASGGAPRLAFVSGRGRFAGWSGRSGVAGPLEVPHPALDGAALEVGPARLRAGAFASWNRLHPASGDDGLRRDAAAHGLSLGGGPDGSGKDGAGGPPEWAVEILHHRVEEGGAAPVRAYVAGAGIAWPGGLGLGLAASALDAGALPGRPPRPGLYAEAVLSGGKHGGYRLEARQASSGWADALSGAPAYLRDTVGGLILPGRGEGGLESRARLDLAGAAREGLHAWIDAGGDAAWSLDPAPDAVLAAPTLADGPPRPPARPRAEPGGADDGGGNRGGMAGRLLAGEGRTSLHLAREGWSLSGNAALRWRAPGLPAAGPTRTAGLAGGRVLGGWRLRASLSRREGSGRPPAWPGALEVAWRGAAGNAASAAVALDETWKPGHGLVVRVDQNWRLAAGAVLRQALRLPWRSGELGEEMGIQLRLEWRPGAR